jgi:hypothetical protein
MKIDIKIFVQAAQEFKIEAEYLSEDSFRLNGITVYLHDNLAQAGTFKFRFTDCFDFVSCLSQEGLLSLTTNQRHQIKETYKKLLKAPI